MRIGFDFDNTIVSYDSLFHKVAREQGVIGEDVPVNKLAVRDYLRKVDKEDIWTEMQGYVYGARMDEAQAYPDVIDVIERLKIAGHTVAIMSHKTRYPFLGEQYDLHASAKGWVQKYLQKNQEYLIPENQIFFEVTKEDKLNRIKEFGCDIFIDDLPEILLAASFPDKTQKVLFDPEGNHKNAVLNNIKIVSSWNAFESLL
jgi:hypothetical protein